MKLIELAKNFAVVLVLLFAFNACNRVLIKDQEWCADIGEFGAECFHTIKPDSRSIEKADWDRERYGMLCSTSESFADMKRTILQLCQVYKKCNYQARKAVREFFLKVENASALAEAKK